ncbi:HdeD family acid-resistance protein [Corynebacterium sp. AOP40-9SA-29]|uniref:HdeD family acid-resistance protein n=1 Tax=Corynebacterium sp. AOP40-9SA-29 TaxID=3457677 RepID=UPI00403456A0
MLLWRGGLSVVIGLALLLFPIGTATVVGLIIGLWLLVDGFSTMGLAIQQRSHAAAWGFTMFSGVVTALAGVAILLFPVAFAVIGALAVLWIMALGLVITGIARTAARAGGWSLATGLLNIVFGVVLGGVALAEPTGGLVALAWLLGVYGLLFGVLSIVIGIRLRRSR